MKKIVKFMVISAVLVTLIKLVKKFCSNGNCNQKSNVRKKIGDFIFKKIARKLELSDEQQDKIRALFSQIKDKRKEHNCTCRDIMDLIVSQLRSDEVNKEEIEKTMDEKKMSCEQMRPFIIEKFAEFHGLLSSWQRQMLSEKIVKIHKKMKCE